MTTPAFVSVTAPVTAPTTSPLTLNLPSGDPTGKLLLAVVCDLVIGAPAALADWQTIIRGAGISIFGKIGELTDSGGTLVIPAFSIESKTPNSTGFVLEYNNAGGVDAISALAKGTSSFQGVAPNVKTKYANEMIVQILVSDDPTSTNTAGGDGPFGSSTPATNRLDAAPSGGLRVAVNDLPRPAAGTGSIYLPSSLEPVAGTMQWVALTLSLVSQRPPAAPSTLRPVTGTKVDLAVDNAFTWVYSDPDIDDLQSKYDFGLFDYSLGTEAITTVTSSAASHTIPAGTLADGGAYQWRVRTYDSDGTVGAWASALILFAGHPPAAPTITSPASGSTLVAPFNPVTITSPVTWQAFQIRRVGDDGTGSPDTSKIYSDTGAVSDIGSSITAAVNFPVTGRDEHLQARVLVDDLWSDWADALYHVIYTAPPNPTGTATANPDSASITVTYTTPAPVGGGQPAAASADIYLSTDNGATSQRIATGLPPSGSWTFWTPASDVNYDFRVVAVAANGATAFSNWIGIDLITFGTAAVPTTPLITTGSATAPTEPLVTMGPP